MGMRRRTRTIGTLGGLPFVVAGPAGAPPLVLLPGLSPEAAVPRGPIGWGELSLVDALARHRRVMWLTRRPGLAPGATMAEIAAEHADVLHEAFGRSVDVLGISTGGSVALQLAADHPAAVRRLVLVSAAARLGALGRAQQRTLAERVHAGDRRRAFAQLAADVATVPERAVALARPPLAAAGWALGPLLWPAAGDMRELVATIAAEDAFDLRDRLGEVRAPTLVVAGGRDPFYDAGAFEQTARGVLDGRLVRFARRGHLTVAADPRFVALVDGFLADAGPAR
jgi:pimeloyl-ACP methyl ester carboxylesterase